MLHEVWRGADDVLGGSPQAAALAPMLQLLYQQDKSHECSIDPYD